MKDYLGETIVDIKDTPYAEYTTKDWALYFISSYGQIDGDHHKAWVLDRVARCLNNAPIEIREAKWGNGYSEYRINVSSSKDYEAWVKERGYEKYMLYGPCHSIGMMEVEQPWMESTSNYDLEKNMTFQVDTFFYDHDFGFRWENGVILKEDGVEMLSSKFMKYTEI